MSENQITTTQSKDVASTKARGFEEEITQDDLLIPRAKLLQALSPEITEGVEGLKPGDIINSLTRQKLGDIFIPIFYFTQWIRFNPRNEKAPGYDASYGLGDIIYRTNNPHDERLKVDGVWQDDRPPLATKFMSFFSVFEGLDMPIVVSFSKTSMRAGKSLLSLAKFSNSDMWSRKYTLKSKKTQSDKGTYFTLDVAMAGLTGEDDLKRCEAFYRSFREKSLQVHVEAEGEQTPF